VTPIKKEEELLMYGRMLNEKKEMARAINNQYEETKYDFVPKINKNSEKIVYERARYLLNQTAPPEGPDTTNLASPKAIKNLDDQMKYIGLTNVSSLGGVEAQSPPDVVMSPKCIAGY
jgi:hypothetical protein